MTTPPIPPSPVLMGRFPDYLDRAVSLTVAYDVSHNLTGATVVRDVGCLYGTLYIDRPDQAGHSYPVAEGTTSITKQQLSHNGLTTIEQVFSLQITAGP